MDFRGNWFSIKLLLVGGLEHFLFFHNKWDNPSHWLFFQRGWNHQPDLCLIIVFILCVNDIWQHSRLWWVNICKKTYVFVPYVIQSSKQMLANSTRCGFIVTFVWFNIHKRMLYINHVFQSYRIDLNSAWKLIFVLMLLKQ